MEADSTTYDNCLKNEIEPEFPFPICPENLNLYQELSLNNGEKNIEIQIVERLQELGLLPKAIKCPTNRSDCNVVTKTARVIDRIQWWCQGCGKRQPVRTGSFFLRLQCSLLQALQMILAWCEDADCDTAAQYFGVKPRMASKIYDHLDDLAVKEQKKVQLGGPGSVVLVEMYPDCLTRLSPDTTDQPHEHQILMMADTNHIPTSYQLHVIKEDVKKNSVNSLDNQVRAAVSPAVRAGSLLVSGAGAPPLAGAATLQHLLQHCDLDMQHFLSTRIWQHAVSLCAASRELCARGAGAQQRYLDAALYRRRGDYYRHMLAVLATTTEKWENVENENTGNSVGNMGTENIEGGNVGTENVVGGNVGTENAVGGNIVDENMEHESTVTVKGNVA